mmetsp:Transcript_35906/g.56014  ORF Transcript_35906/g.56014 Transcript_35906/m.56014 type:complete len:147 (-) Transcript_35906:1957-2397(-)
MKDPLATVISSPSIIGPGRECDRSHQESDRLIRMQIQSAMGTLLMRAMQADAEALGCTSYLKLNVPPSGIHGVKVKLQIWRTRQDGDVEECPSKILTLNMDEKSESLEVEELEAGAEDDEEGNKVDWSEVPGKHWRDKLRRIIIFW